MCALLFLLGAFAGASTSKRARMSLFFLAMAIGLYPLAIQEYDDLEGILPSACSKGVVIDGHTFPGARHFYVKFKNQEVTVMNAKDLNVTVTQDEMFEFIATGKSHFKQNILNDLGVLLSFLEKTPEFPVFKQQEKANTTGK